MHGDPTLPCSCGCVSGWLADVLEKPESEPKEEAASYLGADEMQRGTGGTWLPEVLGKQHPFSFLAGSLCSSTEQQQPTAWGTLGKEQHNQPVFRLEMGLLQPMTSGSIAS